MSKIFNFVLFCAVAVALIKSAAIIAEAAPMFVSALALFAAAAVSAIKVNGGK